MPNGGRSQLFNLVDKDGSGTLDEYEFYVSKKHKRRSVLTGSVMSTRLSLPAYISEADLTPVQRGHFSDFFSGIMLLYDTI